MKDFIDSLTDRIRNPFLFSFIISAFFLNWKIFVTLFFQSEIQLHKIGYLSFEQFVLERLNINNYLFYPLLIAFAYSIFIPIIKELIIVLNTFLSVKRNKWVVKLTKDSGIPYSMYFEAVESLNKTKEQINKMLDEERKHSEENVNLRIELGTLKNDYINEIESKNYLINRYDVSMISGFWRLTYDINKANPITKDYIFSLNQVSSINNINRDLNMIGQILNFQFNQDNNTITFIVRYTDPTKSGKSPHVPCYYELRKVGDVMIGKENFNIDVNFKKIEEK